MSNIQQDNHIYKDLVVTSCSSLSSIEKEWLQNLGENDRFRLIINDTTSGTSIGAHAFSHQYLTSSVATAFLTKCCEIIINNNNITTISGQAFMGNTKKFECLTCIKIISTSLKTIGQGAFAFLVTNYDQLVSLDLSGCTALTTISDQAFQNTPMYMLKLPSSITSIANQAFACSYKVNLICADQTTSDLYTRFNSSFTNRQLVSAQILNTKLGIDNLQITDGIIYGFTPETIKMIMDNPTSHYTLNLSDPSIQGIEYKALDLSYKYNLPNISLDIVYDNDNDVVRRNYINTRFTLAGLEPDFKTILESKHTYNDCTFYIAEASRTGEITKVIDSSVPGESTLIIPGLEFTQKATLKHCVIQYNASTSEMMNIAKIYKDNSVWTIESSSGTKKTLAEYMTYLDIKLGSTPTYDNIAKYAWSLIDNFICSEPFDFTPSESNKLKYVPFEASKITEASITDMVNLTSGNATYNVSTDINTITLNIESPSAYVRFMNLKTYTDQNTKNIILHSVQSNIADSSIYILQCPKEINATTKYIGFEVKELDNNGQVNTALKIKSFDFTAAGDNAAFKTVCYIEGLSKSLTENWSIEADYIYIKNLNIDYMQFINAQDPSTNVVNKISSSAYKLTFEGASSETAKTLIFTNLCNVDIYVINGYSSVNKRNYNIDGLTIIN